MVDTAAVGCTTPGPDRHVGDGIITGHTIPIGEPSVEHAIEKVRLIGVAVDALL